MLLLQRRVWRTWVTTARRLPAGRRVTFVVRATRIGRQVFRVVSREGDVRVVSRPVVIGVRRR